ncbi:gas vesicle protein [Streptomyces piniterrae]|uniref:Gas vesicle protein n=1 Tax=Streptomyces piniterrae TaxID=2571125 RepID=A0A4U0P7E7_9ACTN|nr:gas vesicle protein [Streptomyces piniterrae]TJZ58684.1 gas vesicle protein [Streptomyces piniterrae]
MAAGEEDETPRVRRPTSKKPAKKTAKKAVRKSSAGEARAGSRTSDGETKRAARRVSAPRAMRYAAEQLQELLGRAPESVSAVKPTETGWQADVEVLELERVPGTTSVMASYRVTLDEEGELVAYERTRRYTRGQIDPHA